MNSEEKESSSTVVHSDPFRRYIVQQIQAFDRPTHVYLVELKDQVWDVDLATLDLEEAIQRLEEHERKRSISVITVKGLCSTWKTDAIRIVMYLLADDGMVISVSDISRVGTADESEYDWIQDKCKQYEEKYNQEKKKKKKRVQTEALESNKRQCKEIES